MDKILHDPKDPKLWELWIFLKMGDAGFCPSTVQPRNVMDTVDLSKNAADQAKESLAKKEAGLRSRKWGFQKPSRE